MSRYYYNNRDSLFDKNAELPEVLIDYIDHFERKVLYYLRSMRLKKLSFSYRSSFYSIWKTIIAPSQEFACAIVSMLQQYDMNVLNFYFVLRENLFYDVM